MTSRPFSGTNVRQFETPHVPSIACASHFELSIIARPSQDPVCLVCLGRSSIQTHQLDSMLGNKKSPKYYTFKSMVIEADL